MRLLRTFRHLNVLVTVSAGVFLFYLTSAVANIPKRTTVYSLFEETACSDLALSAPYKRIPWYFVEAVNLIRQNLPDPSREIRINYFGTPNESDIELYILCLSEESPRRAKKYRENCTYMGDARTIVCDSEIVRTFLSRDIYKRLWQPSFDDGRTILAVTAWILSHEIGHLIRRHGKRSFAVGKSDRRVQLQEAMQLLESEADEYSAELLARTQLWDRLVGFLSYDLMYAEIASTAGGSAKFVPSVGAPILAEQVKVFSCGSHPHYVYRALSMLARDKRAGVEAPLKLLKRGLQKSDCNIRN